MRECHLSSPAFAKRNSRGADPFLSMQGADLWISHFNPKDTKGSKAALPVKLALGGLNRKMTIETSSIQKLTAASGSSPTFQLTINLPTKLNRG
ncbi:hypothetical protein [Nitrosospira sp. NRS527]|uniref:hypothetical protein n=1 Tax=Nitrosospira sp. NRS527 TaxID=155925 RepID=UPI001AF5753D|nr:hypothetical protein [Nitrosospira sp. NRS527]BCT67140.1 hypothetical protein NNRS527_00718 [Nitrosospira sp. NRS527]